MLLCLQALLRMISLTLHMLNLSVHKSTVWSACMQTLAAILLLENLLHVQGNGPSGITAHGQSEFEYAEPEHPAARQARIQAEVAAAASAAVDDMDPAELHNLAPSAQPDREIMVYDDI